MQFVGDLDGLTILLTGFSVLLVFVTQWLLWGVYERSWPKENAIAPAFLVFVAIFSFMRTYGAYCPDADQPHIQRTGPINPFKAYKYTTGKNSHHEGILECVGLCGKGVPLMEFNEHATALVAGRDPSVPLTVTYLGRKEQADIWNGYRITAHPVVEIDDSATGERIFYVDTTRHWPRTIVLLADGLACMTTLVLCLIPGKPKSDEEDGSSDQSEESTPSLTD
jgi:hypothetical protein